jgi:hypothetical protein
MTQVRSWAGLDVHAAKVLAVTVDRESGEAAWHYRRAPAKGLTLRRRQEGQSQHVIALSWKAQQRLHHTWRRLDSERGRRKTIVAVAVARELAGFCWAIANTDWPALHHVGQGGGGNNLATTRESTHDPAMSNPTGRRSILDSGLSRRNPVLR